jgi:predicted RNA-binding Zn ribbon-like protein
MGDVGTMALVGGHVAVDFVNTLGGLPADPDDEYLHGYSDLVIWCRRVGLLSVAEEARLTAFASLADSVEARRVLASAHRLRAALDAVLRAGLVSEPPRVEDLDVIGGAYADAIRHARLSLEGWNVRWTWPTSARPMFEAALWPVATSVLDLLDRAPLGHLGQCSHCRWLFLDTSRNHTRRWCSMNACGGTVKMRRHRAKQLDRVRTGSAL